MTVDEWDRAHLWRTRARLLQPGDGDTAVLVSDGGYRSAAMPRIRIADLWAPERFTPGGADATAALTAALTSGVGEWPLRLESLMRDTVISQVPSFERWVANIWVVLPGGEMVDVKSML